MVKNISSKFVSAVMLLVLVLVMCIAGGCGSSGSGGSTSGTTSALKTYIASDLTSGVGAELAGRFTNVVNSYNASDDIIKLGVIPLSSYMRI